MSYGLGRRFALDHRDTNYPMHLLLPEAPEDRTSRLWWPHGWWGNQGETSMCVEYAWQHWLADGPMYQGPEPGRGTEAIVLPVGTLYNRAQQLDEWEGEDYDGTSVRGAAKALQELGYISEYHWAWDIGTLVDAVLHLGPVVIGINWYNDMFDYTQTDNPDPIRVSGNLAGGHAVIVNGVDKETGIARVKNSWGRDWGFHGFFNIAFEDLMRLIDEDGEACIANEIGV